MDDLDHLAQLAGFTSWRVFVDWWGERFPRYGAHAAWFFLAGRGALVTGVMPQPPDPHYLERRYEESDDTIEVEAEEVIAVPRMQLGPSPQMREAMLDSLGRSFTCPRCAMVSYNPNDIEHGYCGNCKAFTR